MQSSVSTSFRWITHPAQHSRTLAVCIAWMLHCAILTKSPILADENEFYLKSVKPVLQARCFACHGALKQEANLRLDTAISIRTGGESGHAILPGEVSKSLLFQRVTAHEESMRMPPEGEPLQPAQIDAIKSWINNGAKSPHDELPERAPKDHWAFRAPTRAAVPLLNQSTRPSNPIDAFIAEPFAAKGIKPQPNAEPMVWLRRVYLDLVGLPPHKTQLDAFVSDHSELSRHRVVDELLNSNQYGERWGRHWMDIWRYSDWWGLGEEVRNSQKHMWHWRDWIVESLNEDAGYDQMLSDMLAADELHPKDLKRLRASGFLARQYFKFNRTSWLDETIEHTSKAMLGITFNCCKCHDHKYDPITQEDYYRLRAVFEPYQVRLEMVPGIADFQKDGIPRAFDCNLDAPTNVHIRGDDRTPDKLRIMKPSVPEFLRLEPFQIEPLSLPCEAYDPALRDYVADTYLSDVQTKVNAANQALAKAQSQFAKSKSVDEIAPSSQKPEGKIFVEQATLELAIAEKALRKWELELQAVPLRFAADRAKNSEISTKEISQLAGLASQAERNVSLGKADEELSRAELALLNSKSDTKAASQKKVVTARTAFEKAQKQIDEPSETYVAMRGADKAAESNLETEDSRKKPFPRTSTGRRTAFAKWLTDRRNPLTARVAINHIWSRHFGRPLVPTVFDFGRKGTPPSNQKLLDWLAVELMDHNWSMKHIHRIIVSSDAYRRTSSNAGALENLAIDPENQYYWRMNSTRMESQLIRDSLLSLAGELDIQLGGPSIQATDEKSRRRSLYFVHSHNEHNKLLSVFDDANVLDCYRRGESIVPQQALALENSKLAMEMVNRIAFVLQESNPTASDQEFARLAFVTILADEPTRAEKEWIKTMMAKMKELPRDMTPDQSASQSRIGLVRGLINHNDFITIR
ncbi:MAG TPA: DUF1553 domain-containing protein [Pirellula sp.]|nr:DUF1553 domain-containing protein [Pirellula sp.]